jgi:hypothetical protein
MVVLAQLVSGGGLGLLVGFLLGLSVSQVVGGVVAALAALLGGFLGLSGTQTADRSWRIGAFGLSCVAGVALGLTVRAGGLLSPSIARDIGAWTAAGYSPEQARDLVAYQRLGVKPAGMVASAPPPSGAAIQSTLFAEQTRQSMCDKLQTMPDATRLRMLHEAGGSWAAIAAAAEAASNQPQALEAGLHAACG